MFAKMAFIYFCPSEIISAGFYVAKSQFSYSLKQRA